jgi:hypothetical protein
MAEPLSKQTFETFVGEHQKYLDSKFDTLEGCINELNDARKEAWKEHEEDHKEADACQKIKFKNTHKVMLVGCIAATILGAVLAPLLGWTHVIGFITKLLTGTVPIGM